MDRIDVPKDFNAMQCNSLQPRDTCYVATPGLTELTYSGYQPHAYSWDDYPPLKDMLDAVKRKRSNGGKHYVGWHSEDEKLYGPTPEIASLTFGCERDFVLKKKPCKKPCEAIPKEIGFTLCPSARKLKPHALIDLWSEQVSVSMLEDNKLAQKCVADFGYLELPSAKGCISLDPHSKLQLYTFY
ncbi:hypothetical protein VNO80_29209 [Phaseolus coccineus]|uniref:Uncharacterized protein n=1 Tax=Phaseolus coccineus TaxID=3886 RepID=A0AAN9LAI5_PHACN